MLKPLIHLELNFVQNDRRGSVCVLLHAAIQSDQCHLLKVFFSPQCVFLASLSKNQVSIGVWIYVWISFSIRLSFVYEKATDY